MTWSFDMSRAPRGKIRLLATGNGSGTRRVPERISIVAAGACGAVTITRWLDDERRWEMFTRDVPPIAWMEVPQPVQVAGADGGVRLAVILPSHPTVSESWFRRRVREGAVS